MKKLYLRKSLTALSGTERNALRDALLALKSQGKYDKYATQHDNYFGDAHGNPFFFPWHRKFLSDLEKELQAINPDIALPYWDSTVDTSTNALPWTNDFMGGSGNPVSGPFSGWGISRTLGAGGGLPDPTAVANNVNTTPYSAMWNGAEGRHGSPHNWVGGNMSTGHSPDDPIFFLHHCFVDKWWSDWQNENPALAAYEGTGPRSPTSAMPPWSTQPNDMLDSLDLDYIYDTDPPRISLDTNSLNFVDVPEGETTVRGVTFSVVTGSLLSFNITAGPGADFGAPFGTSVSVDPGSGALRGEAIVWISYQGSANGDTASGSVTITCPQTGDSWVVPINANTVSRESVGVALILDKSQSMENDAGDGRSRNDLLLHAANIFGNVIQNANGIGIVAFDHNAVKVMDIEDAGLPLSELAFGTGRVKALGHISAHLPNPAGATSIGDGVEMGNSLITAAAANYDKMAMIVFTDGKENREKWLADVGALLGTRVFAIGMGTASELNPAALSTLCSNSGGELYLTDTIDPADDNFKLTKYYLEVLAGITNTDIVSDPEDWIAPGEVHKVPFILNETDITHDVVLLCPAPDVVKLTLETPTGEIIDPTFANAAVGVTYVPGATFSYYRVTLPVVDSNGQAAQEGTWHAVLQVDPKWYKRYLAKLDNQQALINQVLTHGIRYNVSIYALSNLRLRAKLLQDSFEPGANLRIRATITEYGLPLTSTAAVSALVTRPDKTSATVTLTPIEKGVYETQLVAGLPGIYTVHLKAAGQTARGRTFTRERTFTAPVWHGGDTPPPHTNGDNPGRDKRCLCRLLACILGEKVLTLRFEKQLREQGIELQVLRQCVADWCRCSTNDPKQPPVKSVPSLLKAHPELVLNLRALVDTLTESEN